MLKAWMIGVSILAPAQGLWFGSILAGSYLEYLVILLWCAPFLASVATAYRSPRAKVAMGASMAVVAAILVVVANSVFQAMGNAVDFPGPRGAVILFVITLLYSAIGAALGGAAGQWLARRTARRAGHAIGP